MLNSSDPYLCGNVRCKPTSIPADSDEHN